MNIVAVTACPTGIAHTFMAAEQLEKVAKERGHAIKVETQGAMGIENKLSDAEIAGADVAIFAMGISLQHAERFENLKSIEVSVEEAIKHPEAVFERAGA